MPRHRHPIDLDACLKKLKEDPRVVIRRQRAALILDTTQYAINQMIERGEVRSYKDGPYVMLFVDSLIDCLKRRVHGEESEGRQRSLANLKPFQRRRRVAIVEDDESR